MHLILNSSVKLKLYYFYYSSTLCSYFSSLSFCFYIIKVMQSTTTTPTTITDDSIKTKNVPRSSFTSLFRCLFFAHHPWTYLSIWVSFTFFFISTIPHGKLLRLVSSLLFLPELVSIFCSFCSCYCSCFYELTK